MKELIGKRCRIFVKNLSNEQAITYTADVISVDENFITFYDRTNTRIRVNLKDIIQIVEDVQ